jgi:hypothetical protein
VLTSNAEKKLSSAVIATIHPCATDSYGTKSSFLCAPARACTQHRSSENASVHASFLSRSAFFTPEEEQLSNEE